MNIEERMNVNNEESIKMFIEDSLKTQLFAFYMCCCSYLKVNDKLLILGHTSLRRKN